MTQQHKQTCPIAGFLNIFGDHWTLLVVREAFYGATRFKDFQRNTGMARNLLSDRLAMLVGEEVLAKRDIGDRGTRFEYVLTNRGETLLPVLAAMNQWGNEHVFGSGKEPVLMIERATGKPIRPVQVLGESQDPLERRHIGARPGPGASPATVKRIESIDR